MREFRDKDLVISLPTNLDEITGSYLSNISSAVTPAPHYVLIAAVYRAKLVEVLNANKHKKDTSISVICKYVKSGTTDVDFINSLNAGDNIVISGSDLSVAQHINCKGNKYSIGYVTAKVGDDREIFNQALVDMTYNYFVEFKLVPESDIKAVIKDK